jgi:hypothetical protein
MTLQLHRPDGEGGLEPVPPAEADWRTQLRSPRWGSSLEGDRLPQLANPEMNPTSRFRSVLFWLGLAIVTFVILVLGYGVGFWNLSTTEQPSPSASPAAVVVIERS